MAGRRYPRILATLLALLSIPSVFAATVEDVAQSMGLAWGFIGAIFSSEYISSSPIIQDGIIRFLLFILLLAIVRVAAKKKFDNKTSGIIAFVVAAITTWFTPGTFLGYGIIGLALPVIVTGAITYFALMVLNTDWLKHLFGFFAMILNLVIISNIQEMYTLPAWDFGTINGFVETTLTVWWMLIFLLTIVKFFQMLFGNNGLFDGKIGDIFNRKGKPDKEEDKKFTEKPTGGDKEPKEKGQPPGKVLDARYELIPSEGRTKISWKQRPEEEEVLQYEVARRVKPKQGPNFNLWLGWDTLATTKKDYVHDSGGPLRSKVNPRYWTYGKNSVMDGNTFYQYRIRAINQYGKGSWVLVQPQGTEEGARQGPGKVEKPEHHFDGQKMIVTWDARPAEEGVIGYEVERMQTDGVSSWATVARTQENTFVDKNIDVNQLQRDPTFYHYRIRAISNQKIPGDWQETTVTPPVENQPVENNPSIPNKVENAKNYFDGAKMIITWNARPENERVIGYEVKKTVAAHQNAGTARTTTTRFEDTNIDPRMLAENIPNRKGYYLYEIRAINDTGDVGEWEFSKFVESNTEEPNPSPQETTPHAEAPQGVPAYTHSPNFAQNHDVQFEPDGTAILTEKNRNAIQEGAKRIGHDASDLANEVAKNHSTSTHWITKKEESVLGNFTKHRNEVMSTMRKNTDQLKDRQGNPIVLDYAHFENSLFGKEQKHYAIIKAISLRGKKTYKEAFTSEEMKRLFPPDGPSWDDVVEAMKYYQEALDATGHTELAAKRFN